MIAGIIFFYLLLVAVLVCLDVFFSDDGHDHHND